MYWIHLQFTKPILDYLGFILNMIPHEISSVWISGDGKSNRNSNNSGNFSKNCRSKPRRARGTAKDFAELGGGRADDLPSKTGQSETVKGGKYG